MPPMNPQSVLLLKAVDRGFIGGVMVSVLVSKVVDRGLIGGILFSVLDYATDEPTIYCL
jgi:hypothetical protein